MDGIRPPTAESAASEKVDLLQSALDALGHPFYAINANDHTITMANAATGVNGQPTARTCYELTHGRTEPCSGDEHTCPLEEVKRTRSPATVEHIHRDGDGNARTCEIHCHPVLDAEGNVAQVLEYAQDITERRRAEQALQMRDELNRTLLDAIPDMMFRLDKSGTFLDFIPAKGQKPFAPPAQFIGRTVEEVLPAVPARGIMHHVKTALESGETHTHEYELAVNGASHTYEARIVATGTDEVLVLARDVTDRQRAEQALRESEQRVRTVVSNAPVVVFAMDAEGVYTLWEGRGLERMGLRPTQLVGRSVFEIPVTTPQIRENARRALAGESLTVTEEVRGLVYETYLAPVREGDDTVTGVVGVATDITEHHRAERALRESEDRYRTLFEKGLDGVALVIDAKIAVCNPGMAEMLGRSAEELRGRSPVEFVVPEDRERVAGRMRELMQGGPEYRSEYRLLKKDGGTVPVEGLVRLIEYDGRPALLAVVRDVSERKEAEEALRESEERWHSLVENAHDIIFVGGRDLKIQYINHTVPGFERDEVIGTSILDYISTEYHGAIREIVERVFRTGRVETYEIKGAGPRGEEAWYSTRLGPVTAGGEIVAVAHVATDITERKRAEEAVKESEARWRSLVENAPVLILTLGRDGTVEFANRGVPGVSLEQALGSSIYDYAPPRYHEDMRQVFGRIFQLGGIGDFSVPWLDPAGQTSWHSVRVGPLKRDGEVVALTVIATDVTSRKRAEESLRESEALLRAVVANAPVILFALDSEGVYTLADGKGLHALGRTPGDVVGRSVLDVYSDRPDIVEDMRRVLAGEPLSLELEMKGLTFEAHYAPVHDGDGQVSGMIGVAVDVTERRRAEEMLRNAREQLELKVERQLAKGDAYQLTFREFTVLHMVAEGMSDREIATALGISGTTVQKHVSNILGKMQATSRTEAGVRAFREGLLG